jgi:dodecanoy-ACP synthase
MTRPRIAVTGLGAVSGFGSGADRLWAALVEGRRAMAEHPRLAAAGLRPGPVALVPSLPLDASGRAAQFAVEAAREAAADAGLTMGGARLGVVCGTTLGAIDAWLQTLRAHAAVPPPDGNLPHDENLFRGNLPHGENPSRGKLPHGDPTRADARWSYGAPAQAVADELGARGPVDTVSVACASGNVALGAALALIRDGVCDVVVAGGADALNDFVLAGFASLKALDPAPCRPFDRARRGLNLGEGASFLVLEAEPHARARGARVRAFLDGYGLAADAVHMTGPDREGRGAARAMRLALDDAGASPGDVDFVSTHGTATAFNDLMESKALGALLGARAATTPANSIKSAVGHTLGAAGALEALLCVRSLETGLVTPTPGLTDPDPEIALDVVRGQARRLPLRAVLSTSSGFGGANAALLLRGA